MFWTGRSSSSSSGGSSKAVVIILLLICLSVIAIVLVGLFVWPGWLKTSNSNEDGTEPKPMNLDELPELKEQVDLLVDAFKVGSGFDADYDATYEAICENVDTTSQKFSTICTDQARISNEEKGLKDNGLGQKNVRDCWSNCMRSYRSRCATQEWCIYDAWAWTLKNGDGDIHNGYGTNVKTMADAQAYIAKFYNDTYKTLQQAIDGYKNQKDIALGTLDEDVVDFFSSFSSENTARIRVNPIAILLNLYSGAETAVPTNVKNWAARNINLMKPDVITLNENVGVETVVASGKLHNVGSKDILLGNRSDGGDGGSDGWRTPGLFFNDSNAKGYEHWVFINCPKDNKRGVLYADFDGACKQGENIAVKPKSTCPGYNNLWWGRTVEHVPGGNDFGMKLRGNRLANNRGLDGHSGDVKSFSFITGGKNLPWQVKIDGALVTIGFLQVFKDKTIVHQPNSGSQQGINIQYKLPGVKNLEGKGTMDILKAFIEGREVLLRDMWYFDQSI